LVLGEKLGPVTPLWFERAQQKARAFPAGGCAEGVMLGRPRCKCCSAVITEEAQNPVEMQTDALRGP